MSKTASNSSNTIVLLNQSSGYLQIDMLEAYQLKYPNMVIIAGSIVERGTSLPKEVKLHKLIKYNQSTAFNRIFTWLVASFQMFFLVWFKYRKAHIVAFTNPPLTVFIPWILKIKSYDLVVYDAYPNALVNLGYISQGSFLYSFWSYCNKMAFASAKRVFTLTFGMKKLLDKYIVNTDKIKVVPLWSDANDFQFIEPGDNQILNNTSSQGKFCIIYSGNMGLTHPVEKLMELADFLDPKKFSVIIIGGGAKEKLLKDMQAERKFPHVHILPWQPIELLSHSLQAADLSVVTLDKEASNLSIPSKTFNILSVGNPVLGVCELDSGLAEVITENNCGIISDGQDLKTLARRIIKLESNHELQKQLKVNSLEASKSFTKANALKYL